MANVTRIVDPGLVLNDTTVDLTAYFNRIGYGGRTDPTAEVLADMQRSHLANIPFESIDPFLRRIVDISPAAVDAKLVAGRRGGMCFEHANLFRRVLIAIGFPVVSLNARGVWGTVRPRAHHALRVTAEGEDWLVEVGNGAATPTAPLRWLYGIEQQTPHGPFRLTPDGPETVLEELGQKGWQSSYSLSHEPQTAMDFEPGNWWTTGHPTSFYRKYLVCTLAPADARILLFNNQLTVRRYGAPDETQALDVEGLEACLGSVFGLPVEPAWRRHLQRAVDLGAADA